MLPETGGGWLIVFPLRHECTLALIYCVASTEGVPVLIIVLFAEKTELYILTLMYFDFDLDVQFLHLKATPLNKIKGATGFDGFGKIEFAFTPIL